MSQAYVAVQDQQDLQDHKDQEESEDPRDDLVLVGLKELMENLVFLVNLVLRGLLDTHPTQDPMA